MSCERRKFLNVCTTADRVASNRGLPSGRAAGRDGSGGLPL